MNLVIFTVYEAIPTYYIHTSRLLIYMFLFSQCPFEAGDYLTLNQADA